MQIRPTAEQRLISTVCGMLSSGQGHFYHRPIYHVVGLLTDKPEIAAISSELEAAG